MADRSAGAGDLICVIELLLLRLLLLVVVVGDAGHEALPAIFISITRPRGMSASSFSAYLVVWLESERAMPHTPLLGPIHQALRPSSTL